MSMGNRIRRIITSITLLLSVMIVCSFGTGCGSYAINENRPQIYQEISSQAQPQIKEEAGKEARQEYQKESREKDNKGKSSKEKSNKEKKPATDNNNKKLRFRNERLLNEHYEKHGIDMGFESAEEYEAAASDAALNPKALHKKEKEDGDDVYYVKATNEFVIVSPDGYIRTYFLPDSGIKYFNKQ